MIGMRGVALDGLDSGWTVGLKVGLISGHYLGDGVGL